MTVEDVMVEDPTLEDATRPGVDTRLGWCPGCHAAREFETPPCSDHGPDCPEMACVVCGWALIGRFEVPAPRRVRARSEAG